MFASISAFSSEGSESKSREQNNSLSTHISKSSQSGESSAPSSFHSTNRAREGSYMPQDRPEWRGRDNRRGNYGKQDQDRNYGARMVRGGVIRGAGNRGRGEGSASQFGRGGRRQPHHHEDRHGKHSNTIANDDTNKENNIKMETKKKTLRMDRSVVLPIRTKLYVVFNGESPSRSSFDVSDTSEDAPSYIETYIFPDATTSEIHTTLTTAFPEVANFQGRVEVFGVHPSLDKPGEYTVRETSVVIYNVTEDQADSKQLKTCRGVRSFALCALCVLYVFYLCFI